MDGAHSHHTGAVLSELYYPVWTSSSSADISQMFLQKPPHASSATTPSHHSPPHHPVLGNFPRPPRTALDLYQDESHTRHLSFGCPVLDETFGGGIPGHGVIEISGMAGSGKTQLMLQLLIQQVKDSENAWRQKNYSTPFIAGKSFFLSTERPLPVKRLRDMATAACPHDSGFAQRVLESVMIAEVDTVEDQLYTLTTSLPTHLADPQKGIRLCIVDSMSALFRGEFGSSKGDSLDRARMIFAMAKQMKKLSHEFHVPFIVTNQVTADFAAGGGSLSFSSFPSSSSSTTAVQPALGLSWSNCVHTRFLLTRRDGRTTILSTTTTTTSNNQQQQQGGSSSANHTSHSSSSNNNHQQGGNTSSGTTTTYHSQFIRQMRLLLSPTQPSDKGCQFVVETAGVRGLRDLGCRDLEEERGGGGAQ